MELCEYGCGQEAKHQLGNGKWCCSKSYNSCPIYRNKKSIQMKEEWRNANSGLNSILLREKQSKRMKKLRKDPTSNYNSISCRKKMSYNMKTAWEDPDNKLNSILCREKKSNIMKEEWKDPNSIFNSTLYKEKQINSLKKLPPSKYNSIRLTIEKINKRYPFFSKIEEMRYDPNKPIEENEIQIHCKNHECKNSKEKDGWFTPTYIQLYERIRALEKPDGNDGSYLYCSQHCKDSCILHRLQNDPYEIKNTNKPYTSSELDVFNKLVLKRDNEICYYCNKHHATIVHHRRPQKLEPFFALDPDYAISVCEKCHYKYGHPTGSDHSTGNLAKIVCSVESQKFLEQNHK